MWKRAAAAARQAITLDSTLAEAHTILAIVKSHFEWNWEEAEKGFLKALAINPNQASAHFQYAWYLAVFGRFDEAIVHHKMAKELDPLRPFFTSDMGSLYYWTDSLELALKEAHEGLQLNPEFGHGWWVLGNVYVGMKQYDKAIEAHMKASSINPIWKGALASTYAFSGDKIAAREVLEELKYQEMSTRVAFWLAHTYMALGEFDSTFYWLNNQPQDFWVGFIRTWPEFKLLYKDARFHQLISEQGLPPLKVSK
jgi:serine/threonine-protein kinase